MLQRSIFFLSRTHRKANREVEVISLGKQNGQKCTMCTTASYEVVLVYVVAENKKNINNVTFNTWSGWPAALNFQAGMNMFSPNDAQNYFSQPEFMRIIQTVPCFNNLSLYFVDFFVLKMFLVSNSKGSHSFWLYFYVTLFLKGRICCFWEQILPSKASS